MVSGGACVETGEAGVYEGGARAGQGVGGSLASLTPSGDVEAGGRAECARGTLDIL